MFGWLVWAEGSWDENVFKECELAQLRWGPLNVSQGAALLF